MRQVVVSAGSIDVVNVDAPLPGPSEVLVRSVLAGVCGSDTHAAAGLHPWISLPYVSGPECADVWAAALGVPMRYAGDDDAALEAALRAHLTGQRLDDWLSSLRLLRRFPVPTSAADLATTTRLLGRPPAGLEDFARRVAGTVAAREGRR